MMSEEALFKYVSSSPDIGRSKSAIDAITASKLLGGSVGTDDFWMRRCDILDEEVSLWKHQVKKLKYTYGMEQHLQEKKKAEFKDVIESMKSTQTVVGRQKDQHAEVLEEQLKKGKIRKIERDQLSFKHQLQIRNLKEIAGKVTTEEDSPNDPQLSKKKRKQNPEQQEKATTCNSKDNTVPTAGDKNLLRKEIILLRKKHFSMFQALQTYKQRASALEQQLAM